MRCTLFIQFTLIIFIGDTASWSDSYTYLSLIFHRREMCGLHFHNHHRPFVQIHFLNCH